jgi:hypothetical protein
MESSDKTPSKIQQFLNTGKYNQPSSDQNRTKNIDDALGIAGRLIEIHKANQHK